MLIVSELFIYPIKSLGGISVTSATVTSRGFQYDRRWMIVDENNQGLTQREFPEMALLQVEITNKGLKIYHKKNNSFSLIIPFIPVTNEQATVEIFGEQCMAQFVSKDADAWLSEVLSASCRLVYMPDDSYRKVDEHYAINNDVISFSDGYSYLIIGQSSLNDLNNKLTEPLPINRFRPNIVFTGGAPYEEDSMQHFTINGIDFYGVKLCARCVVTTINQENTYKAKEPLKTLATYRFKNNKIYFGQNLLMSGEGNVTVGDEIIVHKSHSSEAFTIL